MSFQPSIPIMGARVWHVGSGAGMFSSIANALAAIAADPIPPSGVSPAVVGIWPGTYNVTTTLTIPANTFIVGMGGLRYSVQVSFSGCNLFTAGGNNIGYSNFRILCPNDTTRYVFSNGNFSYVWLDSLHIGDGTCRFLSQNGATWVGLNIRDVAFYSNRTADNLAFIGDTSGTVRDCGVTILNLTWAALQLTAPGGHLAFSGTKGISILFSYGVAGSGGSSSGVNGRLLAIYKGGAIGTPEIDINNCYLEGSLPVYGELGTHYLLSNTDALGSITDGTRTLRNSSV